MWHLVLFFVTAGAIGTVIGYVVETLSMTTEVLIGAGAFLTVWVIVKMTLRVIRPCLTAIDEAIRNAEESASR